MGFVFADSPQGGDDGRCSDASENRPWLLHTAKRKTTAGPAARAADPDQLLEEVASEANLARALLNVVRNKGCTGGRRPDSRGGRSASSAPAGCAAP